MKELLSHLRSVAWMIPMICLSVLVMGTISLGASLFDSAGRLQHRVAVAWARIVLRICLSRVDVAGEEKLALGQPYVFCSNHFSLIDTPIMFAAMPREFRILARDNLWKIPFLGWHLNRAGHISVRRESPRAAARNVGQAGNTLGQGFSILVFPEGGRTRRPTMSRFRPGAAYIAIRGQVPIVPMALMGTRAILPPASTHLRPGTALLRVGEPIPTEGMTNRDAAALMDRVKQQVNRLAEQPG